jgi:hypothetical protein
LEHLSIVEGKEAEFFDVMKNCMDATIEELEMYCSDNSSVLLLGLKNRNKQMTDRLIQEADFENKDTRLLFKMCSAGIRSNEPEYLRRKCMCKILYASYEYIHFSQFASLIKARLIENIFGGIRDEVSTWFVTNEVIYIHAFTPRISFYLQAHYPIRDSCTLRMIPDHTLLLEEGEVFFAFKDSTPTEIIAMRVSRKIPGLPFL